MIYINGRFLTQPLAGVNRFAYELSKALIHLGVTVIFVCPKNELNSIYDIRDFNIIKYGFGSSHLWEQFSLPLFFIGKSNFLLVSFTGLGPIALSKKIITIHDLAFIENPSWYTKSYVLLYKLLTPLSARTSKHILTVSNFSKKEIVNKLDVNEDKISVIYNAANICSTEQPKILERVPDKYILAVSSIDPRKNFERLIQSFSNLSNCNLVVVGGAYRNFESVNINSKGDNIIFLGRVSDEELTTLYKNAIAFVYPSLYEGFGIPPIEAMTYGCPTVVSDIEVLHEVCDNASIYVNPYDISDISCKLKLVNGDGNLRAKLITNGYRNIRKFNWSDSSMVLKSIIGQFSDL